MSSVIKIHSVASVDSSPDLAPGWVAETIAIWTQFPARKGILDLTNRNIVTLPEEIFRMRKLEKLLLDNNQITSIPADLARLAEAGLLKSIICNENFVETISEEISAITSLEELRFSKNKIAHFPLCITKLFQLTTLDLSYNMLHEIPESLGNLLFLSTLNVSHNNLKKLPNAIGSLSAITYLDCSSNQIQTISSNIGLLTRIVELNMNDNLLSELPNEIGFLLTLERVNIRNNPFHNQKEIIEQEIYEADDLLRYLRKLLRKVESTRILLISEKNNDRNTTFEVVNDNEKPILVGATAEKLVLFLTQVVLPDPQTMSCLTTCYSYFIDPEELVYLLLLRLKMVQQTNQKSSSAAPIKKDQRRVEEIVASRVITTLETLVQQYNIDKVQYSKNFPQLVQDLIAEVGAQRLSTVLYYLHENPSYPFPSHLLDDEHIAKDFRRIREREDKERKRIQKEVKKKCEKEKKKFNKRMKKDMKIDKATEKIGFGLSHSADERHILLFTASEVAMQIALLDSEYFCAIPPNEFLHQSWAKEPEGKRITACINHFNNLSNLVVSWIVSQMDVKVRVRTFQHVLDIANELFELGDFLALFAIASAVSCAAISRLKMTLKQLDEKRKAVITSLEQLSDNTNNYRNYRNMREIRIAAGHFIPNLALYLRNLTFMEDGNPNFLGTSDQINLGKYALVLKTIDEITEMKALSYLNIIEPNNAIRKSILQARIDSSDDLYQQSLACEASLRQSTRSAVGRLIDEDSCRRSSLPSNVSLKFTDIEKKATEPAASPKHETKEEPISVDKDGRVPVHRLHTIM